jgi:UTP--glucose-1-phosphate uridylyltransferase
MNSIVKKAVFPVAGLGTRFLPATKANPKEMLPVVDKPLIQYAVEEAIAAGIDELIFITSGSKRAIEDHFDTNAELEATLLARDKMALLEQVQQIIPPHVSCIYVRQKEPLGLGHAVLCAKPLIGDEPFVVLLADDLIVGDEASCVQQLVDAYHEVNNSVVAVQKVEKSETHKYGIVDADNPEQRLTTMTGIVEKPQPEDAPTQLASIGRYLFTPRILDELQTTTKGVGGEIQLTDAIDALLKDESVSALQFAGTRYDCGDKLGYLQAIVECGLRHGEVGDPFAEYLADLVARVCDE